MFYQYQVEAYKKKMGLAQKLAKIKIHNLYPIIIKLGGNDQLMNRNNCQNITWIWVKIVDFHYLLISGPVPFISYESLDRTLYFLRV